MSDSSGVSGPSSAASVPIVILVDADACPVKDEVYRVAARYGIATTVVANQPIAIPRDPSVSRILVPSGPDAADDWIAGQSRAGAIVITADVPLADRCIKAGAAVIAPNGRRFTAASIGADLAIRNLLSDLRSAGETTRGPKPFSPQDRSRFLQSLDREVTALRRLGFC